MAKKSEKPSSRPTSKKASSKKNTSAKSSSVKRRATLTVNEPRSLKSTSIKRLRFHKPVKHPVKLPSVWHITKKTAITLWQHRFLFLTITAWYAFLNLVFVQGLTSNTNTSSLKSSLDHISAHNLGSIFSGISKFAALTGSSVDSTNSANPSANAYQLILALITSLAVIWALRQIFSGNTNIKTKDSFYKSMYPLIPFILVILVICVQLLPLVIGAKLYVTIVTGGIAVNFVQKLVWFLIFLALGLWSLYMISATIFALYIVTLPDMTPIKSIRSAHNLVRHRRWVVLRKILSLILILLVASSIIILPFILILPSLAAWILFILTMAGLVVLNSYMYILYRELLNE